MSALSDTAENALLNLIFRATAWANIADNAASSPLTNISVSLNTGSPGDTGNLSTSEAAYTSYARVNVARSTGWTEATGTGGSTSPASTIAFPEGTGGSGTVSYFGCGFPSANTMIVYGTVTPNIVTGNGVTPQLSTSTTITFA